MNACGELGVCGRNTLSSGAQQLGEPSDITAKLMPIQAGAGATT